MHEVFLQDLAVVMIVAGLVTIMFHRFKQPVVLGYILAGVIIGPNTPPFPLIQEQYTIDLMAELGILFLMFSLGLQFSLRKLAQVGPTAFTVATIDVIAMLTLGYVTGRFFGWSTMDSLFLGAMLSISSTPLVLKALEGLGLMKEKFTGIIFGIQIVEDILGIAVIALLSSIAMTGSFDVGEVVGTLGRLGVFLSVALVAGLLIVPWLLRYVAHFKNNEMLLITALGLCFGVSLLALRLEYSVALGAFIIGAVIAEAREGAHINHLVEPVRDLFSAVFFVAVGMLIDLQVLYEYLLPVTIIATALIVGKISFCSFGTFVTGHDARTAFRVSLGLTQIGEFAFIIAALGLSLGVTSDFLYPIVVAISAITTFVTPYLMRYANPIADALSYLVPNPILQTAKLYNRWTTRRTERTQRNHQVRALLRRWSMQIALNLALVSGLFIICNAAAHWLEAHVSIVPGVLGGIHSLMWLTASLLALPLLIATFRKWRAIAMVLAEISVPLNKEREQQSYNLRSVITNALLVAGVFLVGLMILTLSYALLPPWPVLIALLLIVALSTFIFWRSFIRVYASAQFALGETLQQSSDTHAVVTSRPIPGMLLRAELDSVALPSGSSATYKLIRELELRSKTGATIVGIARGPESIINPDPDEELQPGDQLLLLGATEQLQEARRLLESTEDDAAAK